MQERKATLIGFSAILLWSLLALFTIGSKPVPPFLLNTLCFGIGGAIGLVWTMARGGLGVLRQIPLRVYVFGTFGLFAYHALYFTAFRISPTAETGLIAYLWPLFIVLFSGFLPGEKLGVAHVLGALIAFCGAALIVLQGRGTAESAMAGLGLAFLCAITWAVYSVASRSIGKVPTQSVTVYCLATAVLSCIAHLCFEQTQWPMGVMGWVSVAALGVGPVGIAFFTWDIGMKRGNIQLLGVASYAAPLMSTIALVVAGIAPASPILGVSAILITTGAGVAARASAKPQAN